MGQYTESIENEVTLILKNGFFHLPKPLVVTCYATEIIILVYSALKLLYWILMTRTLANYSPQVQRNAWLTPRLKWVALCKICYL